MKLFNIFETVVHKCFTDKKSEVGLVDAKTEETFTFGEIDRIVNAWASKLIEEHHVGENDRVVVAVEGGTKELCFAYLAVIKIGAVFCPVDPKSKELERLVQAVDARFVIISKAKHLSKDWGGKACCIFVQNFSDDPLETGVVPINRKPLEDPVHLIFTSASTGSAKAVLCNQIGSIKSHHFRNQFAPFSEESENPRCGCNLFGIWDMVCSFFAGVPVVMIADSILGDPEVLAATCFKYKVSRIMLTPSLLAQLLMVKPQWNQFLRHLKTITLCGEIARADLLDKLCDANIQILDLYSLSECHDVAVRRIGRDIGMHLFPDVNIHIMDDENRPIFGWGNVVVEGSCLAIGYLNASETDNQSFFRHQTLGTRMFNSKDQGRLLPDGTLELKGRLSVADEVKIRGYRISLSTYELEIRKIDCDANNSIVSLAVIPVSLSYENSDLVVCASLKAGASFGEWETKIQALLQLDPKPTHYIHLEQIPVKRQTGKLDYAILRKFVEKKLGTKVIGTTTDKVEAQVVQCFALAGRKTEYPLDGDFFCHGGNSLTLIELIRHLNQALRIDPPLSVSLVLKKKLLSPIHVLQYITSFSQELQEDADEVSRLTRGQLDLLKEFHDFRVPWTRAPTSSLKDCRSILITGGTGFVGAHLISEMLQSGHCWSSLYILSRSPLNINQYAAFVKEKYGLSISNNESRLAFVQSSSIEADDLLHKIPLGIDMVVHLAGEIDMLKDYQSLKKPNVLCVREVVKFAQERDCGLVHLSTSSVLPNPFSHPAQDWNHWDPEPMELSTHQTMHTTTTFGGTYEGYVQSKWVGEQIVSDAISSGMLGAVVRTSAVAPSEEFPLKLFKDVHTMMAIEALSFSLERLNMLPIFEPNHSLSWISVDTLAKNIEQLIIAMMRQRTNTVYHFVEPPTNLNHVIDIIKSENTTTLPFPAWKSLMQSHLPARDKRWQVIFSAPYGFEGLFGYCELPLKPSDISMFIPKRLINHDLHHHDNLASLIRKTKSAFGLYAETTTQ